MEQVRFVDDGPAQSHFGQVGHFPPASVVPVVADALEEVDIARLKAVRAGRLVTPEGGPALAFAQVQHKGMCAHANI